ncbi:ChrR family anti-sigma-E factor [Phyllobacterium sp. YR531]|uniref:ChrR family anti-sigma-E factor n=1 Tax=Phyllobacterium sp. YR531 TaxID=1144343 RepID=UPI00026FA19F|nr:ChrR family anti-sigma-E factor [Phyllobacterium sp. YR531]EJN00552.1 anti-sigma factor, putative, ChrR family [Phyllobacterium sp. YR531]
MNNRPSDEILMAFASGTLSQGPAVVVAAHLALCSESRARVRQYEAVGGFMLDDSPTVTMSADSLEKVLGRLDISSAAPVRDKGKWLAEMPDGLTLPDPLQHYDIGKWKFLAPGVQWSSVGKGGPSRSRPMLLRSKPGMVLPEHTHAGTEYTLVLKGSLHDELGDYGVGDLIIADASLEHEPRAGPDEECICLAVVDGRLRMKSLIGRIVQPLMGF